MEILKKKKRNYKIIFADMLKFYLHEIPEKLQLKAIKNPQKSPRTNSSFRKVTEYKIKT